jgi:hypothetical protein
VLWAVGLVEGLPLLVGLVVLLVLQTWVTASGRGAGVGGWAWLLTMPVFELGKNLLFIWWANRRLCAALRVPEVRWFAGHRPGPLADREIKPVGVPTTPG